MDIERDTRWVHPHAGVPFATTARTLVQVPQPRTSGLVHDPLGTLTIDEAVTGTANSSYSVGVHVDGPRHGYRVPYRVLAEIAVYANAVAQLFAAVSAAAPAGAAAGQETGPCLWLQRSASGILSIDDWLMFGEPGTINSVNYNGRDIVFGVSLYFGEAGTVQVRGQLTVQRQVAQVPSYADRRRR